MVKPLDMRLRAFLETETDFINVLDCYDETGTHFVVPFTLKKGPALSAILENSEETMRFVSTTCQLVAHKARCLYAHPPLLTA